MRFIYSPGSARCSTSLHPSFLPISFATQNPGHSARRPWAQSRSLSLPLMTWPKPKRKLLAAIFEDGCMNPARDEFDGRVAANAY